MTKILLTGGSGTLGQEIIRINKEHEIIHPVKEKINITNLEAVQQFVKEIKPKIIIHCAALTKPMKVHEENPKQSIEANILGTSYLALAAIENNSKLVYISTDYVYPGKTGNYHETDPISPINQYAWSKLGGECAVRMCPRSLILRVAFLKRPFLHPRAFVDSFKSNIYHDEIAPTILKLIEADACGVINVGGEKRSLYEFAQESNPNVLPMKLQEASENFPADVSMNLEHLNKIISSCK